MDEAVKSQNLEIQQAKFLILKNLLESYGTSLTLSNYFYEMCPCMQQRKQERTAFTTSHDKVQG